jgi:hypothetical protein
MILGALDVRVIIPEYDIISQKEELPPIDELPVDVTQKIRSQSVRACDVVDFAIIFMNGATPKLCYEEIVRLNMQNKPILIYHKFPISSYLEALLPNEHLFTSYEDMVEYIAEIDSVGYDNTDRWFLFREANLNQ